MIITVNRHALIFMNNFNNEFHHLRYHQISYNDVYKYGTKIKQRNLM